MTIETHEEYEAAVERLREFDGVPESGLEQEEFFALNAAMVEYETRFSNPVVE